MVCYLHLIKEEDQEKMCKNNLIPVYCLDLLLYILVWFLIHAFVEYLLLSFY